VNAPRSHQTFFGAIIVGLGLSAFGAVLTTSLTLFTDPQTALRCVVATLGLLHLAHGMRGGDKRTGRLVAASAWLIGAVVVWTAPLGFTAYVATHAALAWCLRAPFRFSSPFSVLADLALTAMAAVAGSAAAIATGSPFLAFWCFFLVYALHASIPRDLPSYLSTHTVSGNAGDGAFDEAHHIAQTAINTLASK